MIKKVSFQVFLEGEEIKVISLREASELTGKAPQKIKAAMRGHLFDGANILANKEIGAKGFWVVIFDERFKKWAGLDDKPKAYPKTMKEAFYLSQDAIKTAIPILNEAMGELFGSHVGFSMPSEQQLYQFFEKGLSALN